ncbi:hypothetical protein [Roseobacter sp. GAI101]|uniref:hypothetical protein n=1 Tax=Roseobacter sp. (strain GAI101) TaxID=391589 RepID=UPI00055CB594|nr:hypothetical protein [Roseobacter sp. GAI101]
MHCVDEIDVILLCPFKGKIQRGDDPPLCLKYALRRMVIAPDPPTDEIADDEAAVGLPQIVKELSQRSLIGFDIKRGILGITFAL